jgi:hypothetical protein
MTIGNHGSGQDCPLWKKLVIGFVAVLIFMPLVYKVAISVPTTPTNDQVITTAAKTVRR